MKENSDSDATLVSRRGLLAKGAALGAAVGAGAALSSVLDPAVAGATTTYTGVLLDEGGAVFNVKAYGATGNGSTDDTADINLAIAAASASPGGVVFFPPGKYKTSSTLTLSGNMSMLGAGRSNSIIAPNFSGDTIEVVNVTGPPVVTSSVTIGSLSIIPSIAPTSGYAIHLANGHHNLLWDFAIWGHYGGVWLDNNSVTTNYQFIYMLQNFEINNCSQIGILANSSTFAPQDVFISQGGIGGCGTGVNLRWISGLYMSSVDVNGCGIGILFYPTTNQVLNCFFDQVTCDTSTTGPNWAFWSTGTIASISINNCWGASSGPSNTQGYGFDFENSNTNGVSITNSIILNNGMHGVVLNAGSNISISNCQIFCNGVETAYSYNGIYIGSASHFKIIGCDIGLGGQFSSNPQNYGIWVSASTDDFIISMNRLVQNHTGGLHNLTSGTNNSVTSNITT